MRKQTSAYCPIDQRQTLHAKEGPSNVLHLLLTICTFGLWLIIWIPLLLKPRPLRCQSCGHKHRITDRAPRTA